VVKLRKVGFLPTHQVRAILRNQGVPPAVIDSLRQYVPENDQFKFKVWEFESSPALMSELYKKQFADDIIEELGSEPFKNGMISVFPNHPKTPDADVGVGAGPVANVPQPGAIPLPPRMHITGKISRSGSKLKAIVELSYTCDFDPRFIVGKAEVPVTASGSGLKAAATQIMDIIQRMLRKELLD